MHAVVAQRPNVKLAAGRPAARVAAGIFVTRILGLIRERAIAHFFGVGLEVDAYRAALKIPNVIRNLLGEGTLSASFIPVYAALVERGDREAARSLSNAVVSLLVLVASAGAIVGAIVAPVITEIVAGGFSEAAEALTTSLVRILFPMAAVLIVSAWCLGILNTHRRFFLSYAAPSLWNIAQITTLVVFGGWLTGIDLVTALAWGALAGSVLQLLVQLPTVLRYTRGVAWNPRLSDSHTQRVFRAWLPVVFGAGVMQISSIVDTRLASMLEQGAVANLAYAQLIAVLPVSLFGMSVAAAALPELSRDAAVAQLDKLKRRLADGIQRIQYFVLPSAVASGFLGVHLVGPLYQTGQFGREQTLAVAVVLAFFGIGLPAQALIKLLASGHYAQGDTRTPVAIAAVSVTLSAVLAYVLMQRYGVAGIALGGSIGAYVNVGLNYFTLSRKTGSIVQRQHVRGLSISAFAAGLALAAAWPVHAALSDHGLWLSAVTTLAVFGGAYLVVTLLFKHPDARKVFSIR